MKKEIRNARKAEKRLEKELRKDRLIQTRVDRRLQKTLVDEAKRRRVSVSNLVRNILEDAFALTEPEPEPEPAGSLEDSGTALDHVYAWNPVLLQTAAECSRCARTLTPGTQALIGLSEDPTAARTWLCAECREDL